MWVSNAKELKHLNTVVMFSFVFIVTRRYGPLRGPTSSICGGQKKSKTRGYYALLAHFWQFLVSSSNRGNI